MKSVFTRKNLDLLSVRKPMIVHCMKITTLKKKHHSLSGQIDDAITGFQHRLDAGNETT